jgi:hypothetical protein
MKNKLEMMKKQIATLAAALSMAALSSQAAGLTGSWDFNNANDSVSSTPGTLVGGATISGGQLNLVGDGGFRAETNGGLGGTGSFTVIADFATASTANSQTIFSYAPNGGGTGGSALRLYALANGNLRIEMNDGAGFVQDLGTLDLNDGATHRVAAIFDSNTGDSFFDVDLYVDGSLYNVSTGTDHVINLGGSTQPDEVSVGYMIYDNSREFTGTMDFVQIYDTALTGAEIAAIPEPATLGMIVAVGGAALFIRRRKVM